MVFRYAGTVESVVMQIPDSGASGYGSNAPTGFRTEYGESIFRFLELI